MNVSAVVVNYNAGEDVLLCLQSIAASTIPVEVVVVDNASTDGSAAAIAKRFPDVKLVPNATNQGFAAGANAGVRNSSGAAIVLVNPDARAAPDAIDRLAAFLDVHPRTAAVGATIRNPDGSIQPSKRSFPPLWAAALHGTVGVFLPRNAGTRAYLEHRRSFDRPVRVDWLAANGVAIRRAAFEEVGGFDERFFFLVEDVDLCRRLTDAGWEVWFEPSAEFVHAWGGAWTRRPVRFMWMHNANLFRYVRKHRRGAWMLAYPVIAAGLLARFVLQVVRLVVVRRSVPEHRSS